MKRNFNNESIVNYVFRLFRAVNGRLRGRFFYSLNAFAKGSSSKIYIGKGIRIINSKSILLNDNVNFGIMARLECFNNTNDNDIKITIGNDTSFGDYLHIGALNKVCIGNYVLGGSNILIIDHNHGNPKKDMETNDITAPRHRNLTSKGEIIIKDNVWIGDNVTILANTTIGTGAIIASGSIVTKTVNDYTVFFPKKQ